MGFRVSAFRVHGVLVDTGFPACANDVARYVRSQPVAGAVITHWHEDHAGGAAALAGANVPLWMDARTARRLCAPKRIGFYRRFTWGSPQALCASRPLELPAPLECIATPGHSDDHHVVWDPETRTVFGGDLFIGVKVRVSHQSEHPRALVGSLRRIAALGPARLFDAHKGLIDRPVAALTAKADWTEATVARIDALIEEGVDDATIARRVLGADWLYRAWTAGDYTMANWVRSVRATRGAAD
jgi:glyoxylase-like metal-dependent hydrolase (beta-lactamase superfamily II)